MLWLQAQSLRTQPSKILGLTEGSYEAYCLDQAVWYFGSQVQHDLEQAGQKRAKGQSKTEAARKNMLDKYLGKKPAGSGFADPAAFFQ